MIQELTFVNPINKDVDKFIITYPIVDYFYFRNLFEFKTDIDLSNILEKILKELDCTKEYNGQRYCSTNFPIYKINISNYYYYLVKFQNQFLYNKYVDKLIKRHIDNIIFEYENPNNTNVSKKKIKTKNKNIPNKYIKRINKDMFSDKEIYSYYNPFTKHEITSDNPNLLNELNTNNKKKVNKSTKVKKIGVPISSMTFIFKKK